MSHYRQWPWLRKYLEPNASWQRPYIWRGPEFPEKSKQYREFELLIFISSNNPLMPSPYGYVE
jgi:hypothetical protein